MNPKQKNNRPMKPSLSKMKKKIEQILKEPVVNITKCPYCDFEGKGRWVNKSLNKSTRQRQVLHHLITMHRKEYEQKWSKVNKLYALLEEQRKQLEREIKEKARKMLDYSRGENRDFLDLLNNQTKEDK